VKLPGIHDSSSMTASSSKAAARGKRLVRQQPPGLKMRFRPMGFGDGEPGRIGSSSSSVEEESSSDSDEKMEESPVVFRRPVRLASQSSDESSESEGSSDVEMTNVSLKRKHGGEGRNSKHSSSRSSNIDDRELKRSKKKQTESRRRLEGRESVSIVEPHKSSKQRLPANTATSPTKEVTPIVLQRLQLYLTHHLFLELKSVLGKTSKGLPRNQNLGSMTFPNLRLWDGRVGLASLITTATDSSFTGEGRRKK
jgi:hypothetical protein